MSSLEPVDDLFAGQTLWDGELVPNHAVRNELILDVVHAHARLERVLATFQGAAIAVEHGENVEPHRAVDDARALELIGDAAAVILARDDHHLVLGERPRAPRFLHEPNEPADRRECSEKDESEQSAQARQTHPARLAWRFGRRRSRIVQRWVSLRGRTGLRAAEGRLRRRNRDLRSCRLPLFRLPPLMLQSRSRARLRRRTRAWAELSRPGAAGKHPIAPVCRVSSTHGRRARRLCRRSRRNWTASPESAACAPHEAQDRSRSRRRGCRD